MSALIHLRVWGTPIPKGSMGIVTHRKGGVPLSRPLLVPANANKLERWSANVAGAALAAVRGQENASRYPVRHQALRVELSFLLRRPEGQFGKRGLLPSAPPWPSTKPDIDKLARSTLDPMTGIVWDEDSRIVELIARKAYCTGREAPGVLIDIAVLESGTLALALDCGTRAAE